jgi:hypothetical protein
MRFGLGYRVNRQNNYNVGSAPGTFTFDTTYTRGPNDTSAGAPMGQSLAAFLLGLPTSGSSPVNDSMAEQSTDLGLIFRMTGRSLRA